MTVPFLEARFGECRTPLWSAATPLAEKMVCGAPVLPGKSYCAACRAVLIAGVVDNHGEARWFNPSTGARWRKKPEEVSEPALDDTAGESDRLFDSPDLGDEEDTTAEEAEPEGDRPLQPADTFDWGMAA